MMNAIKEFFYISRHPVEKQREFYFNFVLGILTLVILAVLKNTSFGQESINLWFDKYIEWRVEDEISSDVTFIDFDNQSMEELNRASLMPRDKVAYLVNAAYEGGAKLIIIDFEFNEPDYSPEGAARDQVLYDLLQKIRDDSSSDTKILLPLSTYADFSEKENIFSNLIDGKKIYAVTPNFSRNAEGDMKVRFWLPYLKIKNSDAEEKKILWSIPIMTLVLTYGDISELRELEKVILSDSEQTDGEYLLSINRQGVKKNFTFGKERYKDGGVIRDTQSNQYHRIQYKLIPGVFEGNIPAKQTGHWRKNGLDNIRLDCKNKIVIIGRTDDDCNDIYSTPAGNMTGMYIHGNIIETVLSDTRPHLSSTFKNFIIELFLVVIVAYIFLNFSDAKAQLVSLFVIFLYGVGTYIYYSYTNEFIDLSPAFASIELYDMLQLTISFLVGLIFKFKDWLARRLS